MIDFKNATEIDIPQIQKIAAETWPIAYGKILSAAQIEYMLDLFYSAAALKKSMETQNYIFALHDDTIVGFSAIEHLFNSTPTTRIHKLYILPEMQGLRVGKKFIEYITQIALEKSSAKLSLNVNKYNSALHFYEKIGFTTVKEEIVHIGKNYIMDDFVRDKEI